MVKRGLDLRGDDDMVEIECKSRVFKCLRLIFELREFEVSSSFRVYDGVLFSGQKKKGRKRKKGNK